MMVDDEQCSICKQLILPDKMSTWVDSDGNEIKVPESAAILALIEDGGTEYLVCESCYPEKAMSVIPPPLMHDLHYQFGLEYMARGDRSDRSKCAFLRALDVRRSAEALTGLAQTIQDHSKSVVLLKEAIEISPDFKYAHSVLEDFLERNGFAPDF